MIPTSLGFTERLPGRLRIASDLSITLMGKRFLSSNIRIAAALLSAVSVPVIVSPERFLAVY